MRSTVLPLFLFTAALAAQAPAVDVAGGRRLTLLDAKAFLPQAGPELELRGPGGKVENKTPDALAAIAAFVRHCAALEPGEDVQPLGGRYLAVLASPERCAAVEKLLRTAAERRDELLLFEVHLMHLPDKVFTKLFDPLFGADSTPAQKQVLVIGGSVQPLLKAVQDSDADLLQAPKVCVRPLCPASVNSGEHITYVRDFTIERQGGAAIANPVLDVVVDGIDLQLLATFRDGDNVSVDCKVESSRVKRPLAEAQVDLGVGVPVKVQLPQVSTVRLSQKAMLQLGHSLLLSAPRADGSWLCALVRISRQP